LCDPGVTPFSTTGSCICDSCGRIGLACCGSTVCNEGICDNGKCVPASSGGSGGPTCPLGPTFFLSPPGILDFTNNLPSDCSITPSATKDDQDASFQAEYITCPAGTFDNAATNGVIPTFPTIDVGWATVTGAVDYRIMVADSNGGVNFFNAFDQSNPVFTSSAPAGIYSISVRVRDACGTYGQPTKTGLLKVKP
jgi:hypothetical protein